MNLESLKENIEGIDIYLLDQLLKNRYKTGGKVLDAGCGNGRNLKWFYNNGFTIYGIDVLEDRLKNCQKLFPLQQENFTKAKLEELPYTTDFFDHIICNAVLHFAENEKNCFQMLEELLRVLKPEGTLFIRIASNFGIENQIKHLKQGVYKLPDGSKRFLLTQEVIDKIAQTFNISIIEQIKTTIVHNKRSMTTLMFKLNKNNL